MQTTANQIYRVLIVDDEPNIRDLLAEVLQGPTRSVQACNSPAAALDYLEQNPVDLAFLDMMMPGMTGLELAEKIKASHPETRIVLCTGYLAYDVRKNDGSDCADFVLQKPFNLGEVIELAETCTEK